MGSGSVSKRGRSFDGPWAWRLIAFALAASAGAMLFIAAPAWLRGTTRAVAAYDIGTIVLLIVFWAFAMHSDPEKTRERARREDPGRNAVLGVVLVTIAAALSSAIAILGHGPHVATANQKSLAYGIGIAAVILGWGLIHTMFTFRYAHMFYFDDDDDNEANRGLTFPGTPDPNDYDFAYFAFVVGMTFQVSDVEVTDRGVRRLVLFHGLLSFAYSTAILALGVNIVSGLLH